MSDEPSYPILVDTDALIAVANSPLWEQLTANVGVTTTNVCKHELKRHKREHSSRSPEGSRPYRLHHGSQLALTALDDPDVSLTCVTTVPRPHGADAGEESLRQQLLQHPDAVDYLVLMDSHGRRRIRRVIEDNDLNASAVPPTFLFYILYDTDIISRTEFCTACADLLAHEGWTGYQAVQSAWEGIPVDCSDVVDDELLP